MQEKCPNFGTEKREVKSLPRINDHNVAFI